MGSPVRAGASAAPNEAGSGLSLVPMEGQAEALDYLFMADCREGGTAGRDDDGQDEESIVSGSDISTEEDSDDAEMEDDELLATTSARRTRRRRAEAQYAGNVSEVSEHSASSPVGSGSDDQDWSGCNSSGSAAGDSDDGRSSVSSVDEEIPTNLFT